MKQWVIDSIVNEARHVLLESKSRPRILALLTFNCLECSRPEVLVHLRRYRSKTDPQEVVSAILERHDGRLFPDGSEWNVVVGPLTAWLVTWEWNSQSAEVADRVAAVLNGNRDQVKFFVQHLYSLSVSNVAELATEAIRGAHVAYPARIDCAHITCGSHPYLSARKVSELYVSRRDTDQLELVEWMEPPAWQFDGERVIQVRGSIPGRTLRRVEGRLSCEKTWNRAKQGYANGWTPFEVDD